MTWSYGGDPSAQLRDAVRFYIGDTVAADPQLSDEELDYLLGIALTAQASALAACDMLIAKYSRMVDRSIGSLSISASQRSANYQTLRATLAESFTSGSLATIGLHVYAGGISVSDKETNEGDGDRVIPAFTRGVVSVK